MTAAPTALNVFLSYSHVDELYKEELDKQLAALKRSNKIKTWNDRQLHGGDEWDDSIKTQLKEADIILLLISSDFMSSDYIWDVEIKAAIERHHRGEARVIPVFLRYCDFKDMPFEKLQGYPKNAKPIKSFADMDEAYLQVALGIRKDIEEVLNHSRNKVSVENYEAPIQEKKKVLDKRAETKEDERSKLFKDADALYKAGEKEYNEKNYPVAFELFQRAAYAGSALGMTATGFMYQNGFSVSQDYKKAMDWYQKGVEAGDVIGMNNIGGMYEFGLGVRQNYRKALEWYQKAADAGDAFAMHNLGTLYENGQGVSRDAVKARDWFRKAKKAGFVQSS